MNYIRELTIDSETVANRTCELDELNTAVKWGFPSSILDSSLFFRRVHARLLLIFGLVIEMIEN